MWGINVLGWRFGWVEEGAAMTVSPWMMMHSLSRDASVVEKGLAPGTARRVLAYAGRYRAPIAVFLVIVVVDAVLVVAAPLLFRGSSTTASPRATRGSWSRSRSWSR